MSIGMDYANNIVDLYSAVYKQQKRKFKVEVKDIEKAFEKIKEVYKRDPLWMLKNKMKLANYYKDGAYRCAYLHKHAMIHTAFMCRILQCVFSVRSINREINLKRKLNVCSLGGGPGSDVTALLMILKEKFGFMQCNVSIIDCASDWEHVFKAVLAELRSGRYRSIKEIVDSRYFSYQYLIADLLNPDNYRDYKIVSAIKNADFITMIKFVSAVACSETRYMLEVLFRFMKPGAMVLFVDNAAGGFYEVVKKIALKHNMVVIFGPVEHFKYEEPRFDQKLYGYKSQKKMRVAVAIWQKRQKKPCNISAQSQRRVVDVRPRRTEKAQQESTEKVANVQNSKEYIPRLSIIDFFLNLICVIIFYVLYIYIYKRL